MATTTGKVYNSIKLGGTATDVSVARISHGLMAMTWTPYPVPDEICFESIKTGVDALPGGVKAFLNTGDFYAYDWGTANLEMLSRFFAKYPEYADKIFLSVKGGVNPTTHKPDGSLEYLRTSVERSIKTLGPLKKIDLFEPARLDGSLGIEKIMQNLVVLLKEGKFDHIGLSECNADTLRKANNVYPVTAAEIEISPFEYGENQKKVIATAKELNISIAAYSPLGHGFLTGQIKSPADLPKGDIRSHLTRFQESHFQNNMSLVHDLQRISSNFKNDNRDGGITTAQLCIAWVASLGPKTIIPLAGSSKKERTVENLMAGDLVPLSEEVMKEVGEAIGRNRITGDRYHGETEEQMGLWQ
ncbi:aldo/keto reductase [Dendrothele bispora CBS 962.96]|uniref:Aldo/keto reductase n=1 Tax=Dendrothele bispora (strain CBS 962.96) TaxID=1314807 RepID=A0A4S8MMP0_DENBC|nr:aldo/keto reductase [Dendrothele bispora CBS 962.96]